MKLLGANEAALRNLIETGITMPLRPKAVSSDKRFGTEFNEEDRLFFQQIK